MTAIELARKCQAIDAVREALPEFNQTEDYFVAYEGSKTEEVIHIDTLEKIIAAAQQELLDRLTAGVEVPESENPPMWERCFSITQLLEYGAAQRALGAKEELKACIEIADKQMFRSDMTVLDALRLREVKHD